MLKAYIDANIVTDLADFKTRAIPIWAPWGCGSMHFPNAIRNRVVVIGSYPATEHEGREVAYFRNLESLICRRYFNSLVVLHCLVSCIVLDWQTPKANSNMEMVGYLTARSLL